MNAAGCILILIISTAAGMYAAGQFEKRVRQLKELEKAVLILQREIDYRLSPLGEALVHTGKRIFYPWNQFFIQAGEKILEKGKESIAPDECFEEEIKRITTYHPWEKDLNILVSLGKNLGELDKKMQLAKLSMTEEEIRQAIDAAKEEQGKKGKLYQTLGVCMGVLGVILMI